MLPVVLLVLLDRNAHCCWYKVAGGCKGGKVFKDMWVLDVDRRAWSKVSNLVNGGLHQKWFWLHIPVHLVACPGSEIKTVAHWGWCKYTQIILMDADYTCNFNAWTLYSQTFCKIYFVVNCVHQTVALASCTDFSSQTNGTRFKHCYCIWVWTKL